MNLTTQYMGFELKNPIVPSASPLSEDIDTIRRMEEAGAGAITLHSIFEEQLAFEAAELSHFLNYGTESFAEALSYFPETHEHNFGPEEYLKHIRLAKETVDIPIIASLNGVSDGGWIDYSSMIEEAGADALEINLYFLPTKPDLTSAEVESIYLNVLNNVKQHIKIPVALKLGPFFSAMPNMAYRLAEAGADALVLFNRFYQPDLDIDELTVGPRLVLSTSNEMRLPLRWIAILYGNVDASLALTTGIHTPQDVLKAMMAGADIANVCSSLLVNGVDHIATLLDGIVAWMNEYGYESIEEMQGTLSQRSVAEPAAFERANYMKTLKSYS
ncbi:MAG: dihydroorotate dehydrogenase-like protein [Chloroflexota bacterium]|nr:dihydroorotate dehydrogenase-like protein [Chloroflexota bacterium]